MVANHTTAEMRKYYDSPGQPACTNRILVNGRQRGTRSSRQLVLGLFL